MYRKYFMIDLPNGQTATSFEPYTAKCEIRDLAGDYYAEALEEELTRLNNLEEEYAVKLKVATYDSEHAAEEYQFIIRDIIDAIDSFREQNSGKKRVTGKEYENLINWIYRLATD